MRLAGVAVVYPTALIVSFWLAYLLRLDFSVATETARQDWQLAPYFCLWIIPTKLVFLLVLGQFAGLLSYFSIPDLGRLLVALICGSLVPAVAGYVSGGTVAPPPGILAVDFLLSLVTISSVRVLCRVIRERYLLHPRRDIHGRTWRVGIVGAGHAGSILARELAVTGRQGLRPILFFDDDSMKWRTRVHDIPVAGPPEMLNDPQMSQRLDKVIIAMPSAPAKRIAEVVRILRGANLDFETVPSLHALATGKVKVSHLRPVEIADLLQREPVELHADELRVLIGNRTVMVTGAGGSIGGELSRQIAALKPSALLLVEQSEGHLFEIEQELADRGHEQNIIPVMADILDMPRMHDILERYQPEIIFHAAAHKHVPMMERHPSEAVKNNTLGTVCVATLAQQFRVERFVLISTDKAINPTSVMGATKRLAEVFVQALQADQRDGTRFMAVRFGNVLGSSGSVIPTFEKQIAAGGPVKVTHPDVMRYFMTIPEAVGLVLQCGAQGNGGEIFVLDMGKPVKIVDLARQLIELSGLRPGEDIDIEFVGLRPGEKMFEELSYQGENFLPTRHPRIMRFVTQAPPLATVQRQLHGLFARLQDSDPADIQMALKQLIPEYQPDLRPHALGAAQSHARNPKSRPKPGVVGEPETKKRRAP